MLRASPSAIRSDRSRSARCSVVAAWARSGSASGSMPTSLSASRSRSCRSPVTATRPRGSGANVACSRASTTRGSRSSSTAASRPMAGHGSRWSWSRVPSCSRRAARLTLEAKLRLFAEICDVVQVAHRSLVIHRDLKPSNILVTADGMPKLLDFGIAKLMTAEADSEGGLTRTSERPMTLHYASPEQIRGGEITVASDVWSLGVILHEILVGARPYTRREPGRDRGGDPRGRAGAPEHEARRRARPRAARRPRRDRDEGAARRTRRALCLDRSTRRGYPASPRALAGRGPRRCDGLSVARDGPPSPCGVRGRGARDRASGRGHRGHAVAGATRPRTKRRRRSAPAISRSAYSSPSIPIA